MEYSFERNTVLRYQCYLQLFQNENMIKERPVEERGKQEASAEEQKKAHDINQVNRILPKEEQTEG